MNPHMKCNVHNTKRVLTLRYAGPFGIVKVTVERWEHTDFVYYSVQLVFNKKQFLQKTKD